MKRNLWYELMHNNNNNMSSDNAILHLIDVIALTAGCVTLCVAFFGAIFVGESAKTLMYNV